LENWEKKEKLVLTNWEKRQNKELFLRS